MNPVVTPHTHVFDWFQQEVDRARAQSGVKLSDTTGLYLAQMLADRVRTDRIVAEAGSLAELHGRAANAPPGVQARLYRQLGDHSLTTLGFFSESVQRKTTGPGYYADMGSAAYARADQVFKRWFGDAFGVVFAELARQFSGCVELLGMVRADNRGPIDLRALAAGLTPEDDPRISALLVMNPGST